MTDKQKKQQQGEIVINVTEEEVSKAKQYVKLKAEKPWDPVNEFDIERIRNNSARILARYLKLKNNPDFPKKHRRKILVFALVVLLPTLYPILVYDNYWVTVIMLIFAGAIYMVIYSAYRKLAIDLINIGVAQEKNWYYDPDDDPEKWKLLVKEYVEIFGLGTRDQRLEDQLWGKITRSNIEYDFYAGLFHFTTVSRESHSTGGKTRSSHNSYTQNFVCFKLIKKLKTRFYLKSYSLNKNEKKSDSKPLKFNDAFKLTFEGDVSEIGTDIIDTLSGEVQKKMLNLRLVKGPFKALFSKNCVFFTFYGPMFKKLKTDLFHKKAEIHPEDKKFFEKHLFELIDVSMDIVKLLD